MTTRYRTSARTTPPKPKKFVRRRIPEKVKAEANYSFHHIKHSPYEVDKFESNNDHWHVLLAKGLTVNLAKKYIVRIEPIGDLQGYRTWIDSTGKFSMVAKFFRYKSNLVALELLDGKRMQIQMENLSETDQKHLQEIRWELAQNEN